MGSRTTVVLTIVVLCAALPLALRRAPPPPDRVWCRVFCLRPGFDAALYSRPDVRTVLPGHTLEPDGLKAMGWEPSISVFPLDLGFLLRKAGVDAVDTGFALGTRYRYVRTSTWRPGAGFEWVEYVRTEAAVLGPTPAPRPR